MMTIAELTAENRLLRAKLSPLEDPEFTAILKAAMRENISMDNYFRRFRGDEYCVISAAEVWDECFESNPTNRQLTQVGRSLQALLWERSALNGYTVFVKKVEEYEHFGY